MMCYPKVKYVYCTFTRRYRIYFRKTFIDLDTKSINVGVGGSVELHTVFVLGEPGACWDKKQVNHRVLNQETHSVLGVWPVCCGSSKGKH